MRNKKSLIYMIGGSFAIIAVVAAVVISYLLSPANVYSRQIASAEKYLETGDYSSAILAYQDAIEKDPNSVEAYAGLADVYIRQNDNTSAIDLLRRGVARTDSARLRLMLNRLIGDQSVVSGDLKTQESIYLDTVTIEVVGSYSYADYSSRYGLDHKQGNRDGSVTCVFKGLDAEFLFENTDSQPNAVSATVVTAAAIPTRVRFTNALNIFGAVDYVTFQTLETLNLKNLHIMDHPTMIKAVQFEQNNVEITIQSDANGNISKGADNTFVPLKANEADEGADNLVQATGIVKDAQTGNYVAGAYLAVREGTYETGPVLDEVTSSAYGEYEFNLAPGEYTIEISAEGYTSLFVTVYIGSYETVHAQDIVISKQVASGEARIVLTWGTSPRDLDSYLDGTTDSGASVFTWYGSPTSGSNAMLDIDDTTSFGPETTTLYDINGSYRFYVIDYLGTGTMAGSGAVVTVYLPGQPVVTIPINTGISGNVWCVCEIDHGQLRVVNDGNVWGVHV